MVDAVHRDCFVEGVQEYVILNRRREDTRTLSITNQTAHMGSDKMENIEYTTDAQKFIYSGEDPYVSDNIIINRDKDRLDVLTAIKNKAIELEQSKPIRRGVLERIQQLGVIIDAENDKSITEELLRRYKEKSIEVTESTKKTLKNWIAGSFASSAQDNRHNLYNLCLALDMRVEDVIDFFRRRFMTIPFNSKDRTDAVYYYGFLRGLTYTNIQKILHKAERIKSSKYTYEKASVAILKDISTIKDDDMFLEYLKENTYDKEMQFKTARMEIKNLLSKCADVARLDIDNHCDTGAADRKKSRSVIRDDKPQSIIMNRLINDIYGYNVQDNYRKKEASIKKRLDLPKSFKRCLPVHTEFNDVVSGNALSPETYRKTIILLNLYHFFRSYESAFKIEGQGGNEEIAEYDLYDSFKSETSNILVRCAFVELYEMNPFDFIILNCAYKEDPVECFRDIMTGG